MERLAKCLIILSTMLCLIGSASAQVGFDNPGLPRIEAASRAVMDFLGLTDTPSSYAGQGTNCVKVNAGETGLEFGACGAGGGGGGDKWVDIGAFIIPNSTFADNIRVSIIEALDWTNVTITESQISDLSHTVDTQKNTSGEYLYNDSITINFNETRLNETIDSRSLNQTEGDSTYLNLSGTNSNQDINLSGYDLELPNLTVRDRIFFGYEDHWLKRGAQELFDGIATQTFWFHHDEEHEGGSVSFLVTSNTSGQNRVNILSQVGRNNSAGVLGNSWMILPNNLTSNLSVLSDCFLASNLLNKTLRVFCDTSDTGADFVVQDDIQAFGRLFSDEGIRSENQATFIMNELDFDIVEGDLHLRNSRLEEVGFADGDNVTLLTATFAAGLSPFQLSFSVGGAGEWLDIVDASCFDSPCARAGKSAPDTETTMNASFVSKDMEDINLSFQLTTLNLDVGDLFNVTVNNGSGEFQVYEIDDGVDVDQLVSVILPATMENQSEITLSYTCSVNGPFEECFVDDVGIVGVATANTLVNVTRYDTLIKGGQEGTENIFILYNDTAEQWQFSPNNVSFVTVTQVDLNVTGSITLDGETITNWNNVSTFDDNVLLTNGSRPLVGNWNAGSFNITTDWFFGNINWSDVQNAPAFALITDVQNWINGNATKLDTAKLNKTDQRFNETQVILDNNASWLSTYNVSYHGSLNNASYLSTFNISYHGSLNNASYLSTFNATYDSFADTNDSVYIAANEAAWLSTFNATYDSNVDTNDSVYIATNEGLWISTFNTTYDDYVSLNSTNSSEYWDNMDTINSTQMEDNGGILNMLEGWITAFNNAWVATITTDNVTEGSVNFYDNRSWNRTAAADDFVNISGDTMLGMLSINGSILNVSENSNITHGGCNEWWNGSCMIKDCPTTSIISC